ncbi:hypothetical protein OG946_16800 [Streptomyces sp. NBC_01808]|uniref:hypothetical protein n=1 Tax=Streptomyces sp. NBC_01808 TaxID=2975947 RepID=UPI002DD90D87|nr:hypothetical protein [Streptomyces sp. NBC_01808]WSA38885.1 hypothetical protein OG946_16800 [Streptomyces sp. NBC_01808]
MPANDGTDPRIQDFLDTLPGETRTLVEEGALERREAADLLTRYQTVARERHDEIVALIPQMGADDAIFEAGQRYDADNLQDTRLKTLIAQFPDMRDQIVSGGAEIIRHVDRGLTAQDALYEVEVARVGYDRDPGFREDVEAAFSAGLYETRIDAAIDLDHARDAAWVRSLGNDTRAARENSLPEYIQDRRQDPRSDTPWQRPNPLPAYTPPQPPAYQPINADVARHAVNPEQHDQQSGNRHPLRRSARLLSRNTNGAGTPPFRRSARLLSRNTNGAGTPPYNQQSNSQGGRRSSGR